MFCTNCGKEIKDNSYKFCIYCGAKLLEIGANPIKQEEPSINSNSNKEETTPIIESENIQTNIENNVESSNTTTTNIINDSVVTNDNVTNNSNNNNKVSNKRKIINVVAILAIVISIAVIAVIMLSKGSNSIVGRWTYTEEDAGYTAQMLFAEDNTCATYTLYDDDDDEAYGTKKTYKYSIEDNIISLVVYDPKTETVYEDKTASIPYKIEGGKLIINEDFSQRFTRLSKNEKTAINYVNDYFEGKYGDESYYFDFRKDSTLYMPGWEGTYHFEGDCLVFDIDYHNEKEIDDEYRFYIELENDYIVVYESDDKYGHGDVYYKMKDDIVFSDNKKADNELGEESPSEEKQVLTEDVSTIDLNSLVVYYFYDFSIKVPYDWKLDEFEGGNLKAEKPEDFHYPSATFIKDGKKILTVNEGGIGSVDAPKEVDCVSSKLGNVCRYSFNGNLIEDEYYISNGDYTIIVNNKSNLSLSDFQTICKTLDVHVSKTGNEYDKYVGDDDLGAINEETNKPLSFNEDIAIGHIKINKDMNIKIRIAPSTSADRVALASKEASFAYYKKEKLGDYTWYCISSDNDMWLADDGSWVNEIN